MKLPNSGARVIEVEIIWAKYQRDLWPNLNPKEWKIENQYDKTRVQNHIQQKLL